MNSIIPRVESFSKEILAGGQDLLLEFNAIEKSLPEYHVRLFGDVFLHIAQFRLALNDLASEAMHEVR